VTAIGLLGGTFNPIHIGHLRGAIDCRDMLGLDEVRLLPASLPPLKEVPGVSARHRARMTELAVAGVEGISVDCRALAREGYSYTVDTLAEIRAEEGDDASITFIMGADALSGLPRWHQWRRLTDLANIAVMTRPDHPLIDDPEILAWLDSHAGEQGDLARCRRGAVVLLHQPPMALSSTELRADLARGKNVRFLLPDPVIEYIADHDLYVS